MSQTRRLAAILAADVTGYSRLMGADEEGTHERLQAHLRELVNLKVSEHSGRIVKNTGDSFSGRGGTRHPIEMGLLCTEKIAIRSRFARISDGKRPQFVTENRVLREPEPGAFSAVCTAFRQCSATRASASAVR
jgi:hypothetical protein